MKIIGDIQGAKILFLQGPMGTFFKRLNAFFRENGATTYTICFNAGDRVFASPQHTFNFREKPSAWEIFFKEFITSHAITKIFLFGNCRYYHRKAILIAKEAGIDIFIFEEGYIRPDYITLEPNGVNGHSNIPKDSAFYRLLPRKKSVKKALPVDNSYYVMALQATIYYLLNLIFKPVYPHYCHHRNASPFKEFGYALRNSFRKVMYAISEKSYCKLLKTDLYKNYYFVPLQTRTDFQILEYSNYPDITTFIHEVLVSFANHAPQDTHIVIKHHPMERGMPTYATYINNLSQKLGITNRVITVYDVHLPTCLSCARGTITINSTVGLSSLFHEIPTIALGNAMYDIDELTCCNMKLDQFWNEHKKPNRLLFLRFRNHVINTSQLNGGFYGKFPNFNE
jgi:capsular polysaccharide export protein